MKKKTIFDHLTKKDFLIIFLKTIVLNFTLFIYIPVDSFISNLDDFENSIREFIFFFTGLALGLSIVSSFIICLLPKKLFNAANGVVMGLVVDVYIQYMFMNGKLKLLDGENVPWKEFAVFSAVNAAVWIAVIVVSVVVSLRSEKLWKMIQSKIPAFIGAIQLAALVASMAGAGSLLFKYRLHLLDGKEQYTVSKNENIIVLMLDAVDNRYIKEILETQPEVLEGFEDFTMYTNTCSVYDSTRLSMTQMFTGMDFEGDLYGKEWFEKAWNSERSDEFFKKLHDGGYVINAYNFDTLDEQEFKGRLDNFSDSENDSLTKGKNWNISYAGIRENFFRLIGYRTAPFAMKRYFEPNIISFTGKINTEGEIFYENEDFAEHLDLKLSERPEKYFITEHICGTHDCGDEKIPTTVYLMNVMKDYLSQLKELGVYDNSTIIIMADHGRHNQYNPENAATPMFFIKRKNETSETMRFNKAPIYYEDFQATILECAGLYDGNKDREMFGPTMFDFGEDEKRERKWYDRGYSSDYPRVNTTGESKRTSAYYNVYYGYTYTGDTEDLERIVAERDVVLYPMKDYKD